MATLHENAAARELASFLAPSLTIISSDDQEPFCACFSEDGSWLAVSHSSGNIQIYRVQDGGLSFTLHKHDALKYPCLSMCFRPTEGLFSTNNVLISTDVSGQIHHWHAASGKHISTIKEPGNEIFTLAHQETGILFATAGLDTKVRVYDGQTRKLLKVLDEGNGSSTAGHTNRVFALRWSSTDTHVILSGGWDKTIQFWDLRTGKSVRSIFGPYLCGASLDIDDSSTRIVTGSWRASDQLQEWDYRSGGLVHTFIWPRNMSLQKVYTACYGRSMVRKWIAAGGNQASVFHSETGQFLGCLQQAEKGFVSMSFNRVGTQMCVVTANQVLIFDLLRNFKSLNLN